MLEVVAVAISPAEERAIEQQLAASGVAYETRLEGVDGSGNVCFLGCSYVVDGEIAGAVREQLRKAGLPVAGS